MEHELTKQDADILLIELMVDNDFDPIDAHNYARRHRDEINKIQDIFGLKEYRDWWFTLGLYGLIAQDQGEKVVDSFSGESGLPFKTKNFLKNLPKEDIKLLLAACYDRRPFYYHAFYTCQDIKAALEKNRGLRLVKPEYLTEKPTLYSDYLTYSGKKAAADPINDDDEIFLEKSIVFNGFEGELRLKGNKYKQVYLEFSFKNEQNIFPFELDVSFTTLDGKPLTTPDGELCKINIPTDKCQIIRNPQTGKFKDIRSFYLEDVDYSNGIGATINIYPDWPVAPSRNSETLWQIRKQGS